MIYLIKTVGSFNDQKKCFSGSFPVVEKSLKSPSKTLALFGLPIEMKFLNVSDIMTYSMRKSFSRHGILKANWIKLSPIQYMASRNLDSTNARKIYSTFFLRNAAVRVQKDFQTAN
jgi:hypothetical protein